MGPAAAAFYKKGHGEGPTTSTRNDDGQRGSAVHSAGVRRDRSTRIRTDAAEDSCSQNRLTRIGAPRRPAAGRLQEENQGRWGVNLVSARRPRMGGTDGRRRGTTSRLEQGANSPSLQGPASGGRPPVLPRPPRQRLSSPRSPSQTCPERRFASHPCGYPLARLLMVRGSGR